MNRSGKLAIAGTAVVLGAVGATTGIAATGSDERRAAAPAGAAAGTVWPIVQNSPTADAGSSLSDIASAPDGTMWAAGGMQKSPAYKPILKRLTGGTWSDVALPASLQRYRFTAASATSGSNLWVAGQLNTSGDSHALLRWNGSAWTTFETPLSFQPADIATAGPASTWAVSALAAKHWNGSTWADTPIGIRSRAIAAVSPTSAWAVGLSDGYPATARWNGTQWVTVPFPKVGGGIVGEIGSALNDVYVASGNDVWAVGTVYAKDEAGKHTPRGLLARWNGTKWTYLGGAPGSAWTGVASDGAGGIRILTAGDTVINYTAAGAWTEEALAKPAGAGISPRALANRPGTTTMWAVGWTTTDTARRGDLALWHSN